MDIEIPTPIIVFIIFMVGLIIFFTVKKERDPYKKHLKTLTSNINKEDFTRRFPYEKYMECLALQTLVVTEPSLHDPFKMLLKYTEVTEENFDIMVSFYGDREMDMDKYFEYEDMYRQKLGLAKRK